MKRKYLIIALVLFIASCAQHTASNQCAAPMIKVGSECCTDSNKNSICDDFEPNNEAKAKETETGITGYAVKEEKLDYPNLSEIQSDINKTYYPIKKYVFNNTDEYNLTGIWTIFNVSGADRFYILTIKKEHNYLNNEKNFSDFMQRMYNLRVKNNEVWGPSYIDSSKQTYYDWEEVKYVYDHDLTKINVLGKPAYLEKHYEIFDQNGNLKDFWLEYRINIWCTPESVVLIYPSDKFGFYYTIGSFVETELKYVNGLLNEEYNNMHADAEKIIKLCGGNPEYMKFGSNEAIFYGRDAFYPTEIRIKAGGKMRLHNENDYNRAEIFTFIRQNPHKVFISGEINYTTYADIQINETGNYTFFTPHYAGRAFVIVE